MGYVGKFGDMDPYWDEKQNAQMGGMMQGIVNAFMQRKQKKEEDRDREINTFFQQAGRFPEIIDTMGPHLVEKYGNKVPGLSGAISAMQERQEIPGRMRAASEKWLAGADQMAAQGEGAQAMLGQMGMMGPGSGVPNPAAMMFDQANLRETALARSAQNLSPSEKAYAQAYARGKGMPFPNMTTPTLADAPSAVKGDWLGESGFLPPDTAQAQRYRSNLDRTPQQEARSQEVERRAEQRDTSIEIQRKQLELSASREQRLQAKGGKKGEGKPFTTASMATILVQDTKALAGEKAEVNKAGKRKRVDGATYRSVQGHSVEPMLRSHASTLAKKVETEIPDPAAQAAALNVLVKRYVEFMQMGISRDEAIQHLVRGTRPDPEQRQMPIQEKVQ